MTRVDRRRIHGVAVALRDALVYPLTSDARLLGAGVVTIGTYVLLVLSTYPQFTRQFLERDLTDVTYGVSVLTREVYLTSGWLGLSLVVLYALLTGVAVTNAAALLRRRRRSGATGVAGILPGVLAAGCASCGAGVLGALGFVGAMAALPYDGTLLRVGGIVLLVGFLTRSGDPRTCSVGAIERTEPDGSAT
ncbi:hypothetical protein L593_02970 [Salinarchaeum sp. Harcht-Bsk1]|uniref:hypothetical protein n=1 Tax=Salinarchaeum sp. Harcht-Bsk1 TaxID=1333523 RepID=UPI00034243AF|nr:hypothetical protein [Salinarchaeum sp. Harcht-Bsk1]AGN00545.1 hypothetical protein L593_02970 [Salinarchaeum sp. Harcht-Bsk1]